MNYSFLAPSELALSKRKMSQGVFHREKLAAIFEG
jgi:hypothetical protein